MASPDMVELWPVTWKETSGKAFGIINTLQVKTAEKHLELSDLSELNVVISHLLVAWERPWGNHLIASGMRVIRAHFYRRLSLDLASKPRVGFRRILEGTLPSGFFEHRDPEDPELKSMAILMSYHDAMRRKEEPGLDFTTLINPAYKPGPVGL